MVGVDARDRAEAVEMYRAWLLDQPALVAAVQAELRGKTLACSCPVNDQPCHADALLEVANLCRIEDG